MSTAVIEPVETDEAVEIKDPKAVLEALERAKKDAKTHREQAEALQEQLDASKAELESLKQSQEEHTKSFNDSMLELHIEKELAARGLSSQAERVRKYLSRDGLSIGEDKSPVGLNEAFETLKTDFPEIFDVKKRVGGGADQFNTPEPVIRRTGTEAQVAKIFGKA